MLPRLIACLGVAFALLVIPTSIQAHNGSSNATWSVTIVRSGTLTASFRTDPLTTAPLPPGEATPTSSALVIDLADLRGVPTGWTVLVSTVDPSAISMLPGSISTWAGNSDLGTMETFSLHPLTLTPTPLWTVGPGRGDGIYSLATTASWRGGIAPHNPPAITLILDLQGDAP